MHSPPKKLVEAYRLSDDDNDVGEIAKGCALIRANFGTDPGALGEEEWAMMFNEAVWLERTRLINQAKILARLFSAQSE